MVAVTEHAETLRAALRARRAAVDEVLARYDAVDPRLFGSVARGDATASSDIDLMVDLIPQRGNELLRLAGLTEELSELLGARVDVVAETLLRPGVSDSARRDAVRL